MAESLIVKTIRDGTLAILDGSDATIYTVAYENGDFNLTIPGKVTNAFLDRNSFGSTPSVRFGADQPMTGTFSAHFRDVYDATYNTLIGLACDQVITGTGTLGATGEVKLWKMKWTIEGTDHNDSADHTITCSHCRFTVALTDGDPNNIAMSFTSYQVYPTLT